MSTLSEALEVGLRLESNTAAKQHGSSLRQQGNINIITNCTVSRDQPPITCTDSAIIQNNNSDIEKHRWEVVFESAIV